MKRMDNNGALFNFGILAVLSAESIVNVYLSTGKRVHHGSYDFLRTRWACIYPKG